MVGLQGMDKKIAGLERMDTRGSLTWIAVVFAIVAESDISGRITEVYYSQR